MGFNKALYYPTIDICNEDWLKNAVLFWDEINTIVPSTISNPYQQQSTQYLFDEGILKPISINPDHALIQDLTTETLNYLNTNEALNFFSRGSGGNSLINRQKLPKDVSRLFAIHQEKLPYEIQYQLRHSITDDGWFEVDSSFAKFYMTLLANKICEKRSIALLADNSLISDLSGLVQLDNRILINGNNTNNTNKHLAQGMLTTFVMKSIQISEKSSLEDVLNFKKNNQDSLAFFRNNLFKLIKDISEGLSYEAVKQEVETIYNDEFCPAYNNFKKSLEESGIKWTADNLLKVSFFSAPTTSLPLVWLGQSVPLAILAGAGVSMVTSIVSYNLEKRDKLRNNPYSYLLALNGVT